MAAGIAFRRLPMPDRQVPDRARCMALAAELRGLLDAGQGVAVHVAACVSARVPRFLRRYLLPARSQMVFIRSQHAHIMNK